MPAAPHPELSARFGRPCWFHPVTGSTNDDASALARAGAPHGALVLADEQRQGRGRLGRSWFSPPAHNLYFSLILRPRTSPADTGLLTLAAGVAIAEVLGLGLKWPNDVVYQPAAPGHGGVGADGVSAAVRGRQLPDHGFRKVAGLLTEMDVRSGRVEWVVLGVGLNVDQPSFPDELPDAASLRMLRGAPQDRMAILEALLPALDARTEQIHGERGVIIDAWSQLSAFGQRRLVCGALEGVSVGLRSDGALLLRDDAGTVHPILAGDVLLAQT